MEAKLQRRVQRYGWDKAAGSYERFWARQIAPSHDLLLDLAALEPGERVLDIAAGTGLVSFRAADAVGARGEVLGTDISEAMVESARVEAATRGYANLRFERMEAERIDLDDSTFDAALCALGLMYVPDPALSLREMHRVLRPNGRTVASVWGRRGRCGWAEIFPIVDSRVRSDVCPLFFRLGTGDLLARTFEEAGYVDVSSDRLEVVLEYDSNEDACGAAFAGGPVALAYSRFDERTREDAHREYLASIESFQSASGGYRIPGEFVVVRGRRE